MGSDKLNAMIVCVTLAFVSGLVFSGILIKGVLVGFDGPAESFLMVAAGALTLFFAVFVYPKL